MNPAEDKTMKGEQARAAESPQPSSADEASVQDPAGADAPEDNGNEELASLRQAVEEAQNRATENWEQVLRMKAEAENQRRRAEKQVEDARKYALQRFVESLLPVRDSLEMGLQAEGDVESIREGMDLTLKQFTSVMEKFNVETVNPLSEPFNPELHQAVAMQSSEDFDNNVVMDVMQKGYTLNGRVVRPAMVVVCKK